MKLLNFHPVLFCIFTLLSFVGTANAQDPVNVALNATISAYSSYSDATVPPSNILDGITTDPNNCWSASGFSQWVEIDLGDNYDISSSRLVTYQNRAYRYEIDAKREGGDYFTIVDRSDSEDAGPILDNFSLVTARYVKLTVTGAYDYTGDVVKLNEFEIFGVLNEGEPLLPLTTFNTDVYIEGTTRMDRGLDLVGEGLTIYENVNEYELVDGVPSINLSADGEGSFRSIILTEGTGITFSDGSSLQSRSDIGAAVGIAAGETVVTKNAQGEVHIGGSSTTWGNNTSASGSLSTAWGDNTSASGMFSTSWGLQTVASEICSTAWGFGSTASGVISTAWGYYSTASGMFSTAWGYYSTASGSDSTAWGVFSIASGSNSTAWGKFSTASGSNSTAWGSNNVAPSLLSTSMGRYNVGSFTYLDDGNDLNDGDRQWFDVDPLFEVGNGTSEEDRTNALTILKNGKVGVGLWGDDLWDTTTVGKNTADSILRAKGKIESTEGGFVLPDGTVIASQDDLGTGDGTSGTKWYIGTYANINTTAADAIEGDLFLDAETGNFYIRAAASWPDESAFSGNLKGPAAEVGPVQGDISMGPFGL